MREQIIQWVYAVKEHLKYVNVWMCLVGWIVFISSMLGAVMPDKNFVVCFGPKDKCMLIGENK